MHAPNAGLAGFLSKRSFGLVYRSSPANQEPANRLLIAEELKKYIAIRGVCAIMCKLFQVRAGALRLFWRKLMGFLNKRILHSEALSHARRVFCCSNTRESER